MILKLSRLAFMLMLCLQQVESFYSEYQGISTYSLSSHCQDLPHTGKRKDLSSSSLRASSSTAGEGDDFERLFQEQTMEYGVDLAKEFQNEQKTRMRLQQQLKKIRSEPSQSNDSKSSAGLFQASPSVSFSTLPTPSRRPQRAGTANDVQVVSSNQAQQSFSSFFYPWTSPTASSTDANNGDNLFLIMTATMTAYTTGNPEVAQPVSSAALGVMVAIVLAVTYLFWLGDETVPVMNALQAAETMDWGSLASEASVTHGSVAIPHLHSL